MKCGPIYWGDVLQYVTTTHFVHIVKGPLWGVSTTVKQPVTVLLDMLLKLKWTGRRMLYIRTFTNTFLFCTENGYNVVQTCLCCSVDNCNVAGLSPAFWLALEKRRGPDVVDVYRFMSLSAGISGFIIVFWHNWCRYVWRWLKGRLYRGHFCDNWWAPSFKNVKLKRLRPVLKVMFLLHANRWKVQT